MTQALDVFISYAREDKVAAARLYNDLRGAGVNPWIDTEDLLPGEDWRLGIRRAIENSTYFLALMSAQSLAKRGYVQKELRLAYAVLDELPLGHIFLIPIRLEPCEPTDERIKAVNWLDLFPSYEAALKKLLRGIAPNAVMRDQQPVHDQTQCPNCGHTITLFLQSCPACATPLAPANVRRAISEAPELERRYTVAIDNARVYGTRDRIAEFEAAFQDSRPVLSTNIQNLVNLLRDEKNIYSTYYQLVNSGLPVPSGETENVRTVVDAVLFPGNAEELRFAALSLNERGLRSYGPVWIALKQQYISHRTTVTESSSFKMVSAHLLTDEFPRGYISTWDDRHKLAVAKLAHKVTDATDSTDFANLLLQDVDGEDDFMEVQIAGPFNKSAFRSIAVDSRAFTGGSRVLLRSIQEICEQENIPFHVIGSAV
jgi:hypothetical protein